MADIDRIECELREALASPGRFRLDDEKRIRLLLDELSRRSEVIERAKEALRPFAKYMESGRFDLDNRGEPLPDDQGVGWIYLTIGDFRRATVARALLQGESNG